MRQRLIIMVICLFAYLSHYAQFKMTGDKEFKNYSDSLLQYAGIKSPDFSNNDFEMRFWIIRYVGKPHAVFIFKHNKYGKWSLKSYHFCTTDWIAFNALKTDSILLSQNWTNRWDSLNKNNILQLPAENKVSKKWKSSTGIIPVIADGLVYRIELFTAKRRRRYSYINPEVKLSYYNLQNKDLVAINKIIAILNNELHFKDSLDEKCK